MRKTKKLAFTTDRLPMHFLALGYLLAALGVWRIIVADWKGILYLSLAVVLVFFKAGIVFYLDKQLIKKYVGVVVFKKGKPEDIKEATNLWLVKSTETYRMSVLTLNRTASHEVYKLVLNMPHKTIELMKGNKEDIIEKADKIAAAINVPIMER